MDWNYQEFFAFVALLMATVILTAFALVIIYSLWKGKLEDKIVNFLLEVEKDGTKGKPSISRLQMIIWNFTIGFAFLYIVSINYGNSLQLEKSLEALFRPEILVLLGISNVTYLIGKGIKQGSANEPVTPDSQDSPSGTNPDAPDKSVTRISPSRGTVIIENNDE